MGGGGRRITLGVSVAGAGWAAVALVGEPVTGWAVPLLFAAGVLTMLRLPVTGALVVVATQAWGMTAGIPHDNPSGLVAGLGAMALLGLHGVRPVRALVPVTLSAVVVIATDLSAAQESVGVPLFAAAYFFGAGARRHHDRLEEARARVARLEAEEITTRAERIVVAERHRLAASSAALVRAATIEMQELARTARRSLAPATIRLLRERGVDAVDELRVLLQMLRRPGSARPAEPAAPAVRPLLPAWTTDLAIAASLALTVVVEWWTTPGAVLAWPLFVLCGAAALRRRPVLACAVATCALGGLAWVGYSQAINVPVAAATALLTWDVLTRPTRVRGVALAGTVVTALGVASAWPGGSAAILANVLALTAVGTVTWRILDRRYAAISERSERYANHLAEVVAAAVAEERVAVARDLHDVTSRALGVMVLHASSAAVARDDAAARLALDVVVQAGDDALTELARLQTALGPAVADQDLATRLHDLVATMRRAGLRIELQTPAAPVSAATADVAYRVVSEALTNVVRHAPGAGVRVTLTQEDERLQVRVRNDGVRRRHGQPGTGHGLLGLQEQVARCAGQLHYRHLPDGGFEVEARLAEPRTHLGAPT